MHPAKSTEQIKQQIAESARFIGGLTAQAEAIQSAGQWIVEALQAGGTIMTAGNGGSAAQSLHMAEELTGRFRGDRCSLAGISLCADPTTLTCIGNDFGFEAIFSRQVEGLGRPGDLLVLFSTSGRSANLTAAAEAARAKSIRVVCVLGRDGGDLKALGDVNVIVPGNATERIQEAHQVVLHLFLDAVESVFCHTVKTA